MLAWRLWRHKFEVDHDLCVEFVQADISASRGGAQLLQLDINMFYKVAALVPDFIRALQTSLVLPSPIHHIATVAKLVGTDLIRAVACPQVCECSSKPEA